ncbi:hypothetical protein ACFWIY_35200 [Streptomyces sioyaensis]|uniref:hypothetical protein n=1 Tax=Streptomyces sioyaensis TaxID=67364 RepID=UPI0036685AEE
MGTLTFVDETTSGDRSQAWGLAITEERLALREVIRRRVFQEVAEHNARLTGGSAEQAPTVFRGLVQPADTEPTPGGYALPERRRIDPEKQCASALHAFARNGFVVLVGDRQMEDLDTEIELSAGTEVTFLKLVPLVGG